MATLKSIKNKYLSASDGAVLGVTTNTENVAALSFKLATADSLSKFNLVDGFSDDYNDATGVDASASTDEIRSATANYYSGGVTGSASGGTETSYSSGGNDYKVHTFLTTSTFTISGGTGNVDILVVGGGGGSGGNDGNNGAGGGGGGGMREITGSSMTEAVFDVTVGAGVAGGKGGNSSVVYSSGAGSGFTAISGTGGGTGGGAGAGSTGGSGGGHGGWSSGSPGPGSAGNEGGYTPVEGYDGGDGSNGGGSPPCPSRNGGGGGGAGGAGSNAPARSGNSSGPGGAGGVGRQNSWRTGSNVYYAGGGGGAGTSGGVASGGSGGGGAGGEGYSAPGTNGTTNTGGGAGGGSHGTSGATGGSGIVVLRYIDGAFVAYNDMTLQSNVFTAQAAPTTARMVMDEFTAAGSSTLNTDLKAYASRDNGTTFTQMTLADQGYLNPNSGIDGYTKLMLHCDGSNSGTTFTDSSLSGHTVTASGNAVTNVATKKFGTASYKCPATGDFLSIPDSEDWNFGSGDFTIDCWLYRTGTSAYQTILEHKTDNSNYWQWRYFGGSGNFDFTVTGAGAFSVNWTVSAFAQDTWVHHQLVRNGNSWYMFQNGTQVGGTQTQAAAVPNMTGDLILQGDSSLGQPFVGFMDEFRISKGIARNTSNFAVPSGEYVESRRLLSGSVDISGQPSGTNMKYKITTHNQTLAKQTRVYGTSMAWA